MFACLFGCFFELFFCLFCEWVFFLKESKFSIESAGLQLYHSHMESSYRRTLVNSFCVKKNWKFKFLQESFNRISLTVITIHLLLKDGLTHTPKNNLIHWIFAGNKVHPTQAPSAAQVRVAPFTEIMPLPWNHAIKKSHLTYLSWVCSSRLLEEELFTSLQVHRKPGKS